MTFFLSGFEVTFKSDRQAGKTHRAKSKMIYLKQSHIVGYAGGV
jgi:hypothetical protein